VDINGARRYNKFDPYILASQADQVCLIPYPRIRQSGISWLAAIKVTPRVRVIGDEQPPFQEDSVNVVEAPEQSTDEILLVDPQNPGYEDLPDDITTDEGNEDEFEESDAPSDEPSDGNYNDDE